MKFLNNLDLNRNEIQNARVQNLGSAPTSPVAGQVYYDSGQNTLYVYNGTAWRPLDAAKLADGSITISALATNPLNRANHTGTQTASTISDFNSAVQTNRLDQLAAPMAAVNLNSQRITNLAEPVSGSDAATKNYVDNRIAGLSWKDEVRVATTVAGTLATSFANGQTVDGVVLATGDRILIKDQSTASENGIYTVNASGAPTRATDADTGAELSGAAAFVTNGTTNGGTRWVCNTTGAITVGTTSLTFVQFGAGASYTAGNGLTLTGNDFNVGAGAGISVSADAVAIDTTVVVRKYAATIGNGSSTSIAVTHGLGTQDVTWSVRQVSDNAFVICDAVATDANRLTLTFSVAPAASSLRVVVHA